ncbi:MAG: glycosyltransferase family 2 protein [Candidatus Microgenomates bacterium]
MLTVSTQITVGDDLSTFTRMLNSVYFADEILIFNMERDDKETLQLFKKFEARVINVKTPKVVEFIRSKQVSSSRYDWVLIMDYDEVIPGDLANEIKSISERGVAFKFSAYYLTRRNFSLGYPLGHGGFGDDQVPRLFYKPNFVNWSKEIHGMPKIRGEFGYIEKPMEHHKDASLAQMVTKTNRYTDVEALQFFEAKAELVTSTTLFRKTIMEFIRRYFIKAGFLDGRIGLIQAIYQSYAIYLRYAKLYELQKNKGIL